SMTEAPRHPHATARDAFVDIEGVPHPAPAHRFSRTPPEARIAPERGADTDAVLREAGFSAAEVAGLRSEGVVG
ncbi:MAG: CoA transferase, partial [Acetobacteraceae bacterium]